MGKCLLEMGEKEKLNGTCEWKEGSSVKSGGRLDLIGVGSISFFYNIDKEREPCS